VGKGLMAGVYAQYVCVCIYYVCVGMYIYIYILYIHTYTKYSEYIHPCWRVLQISIEGLRESCQVCMHNVYMHIYVYRLICESAPESGETVSDLYV